MDINSRDIKLSYRPETRDFDISVKADFSDLELDDGLETAVNVSLFGDARTNEALSNLQENGGCWMDSMPEDVHSGSLLWLLSRSKITDETMRLAEDYAGEALKWMIDDGVAKEISVEVTRVWSGLHFFISIVKPDNVIYKYKSIWNQQ